VLGLWLEAPGVCAAINCLPQHPELCAEALSASPDTRVAMAFGGLNPANLGGIWNLAEFWSAEDSLFPARLSLAAPGQLCGWVKALMQETDYSSRVLSEISFLKYPSDRPAAVMSENGLHIEHIPDMGGCFDSIFQIRVDGSSFRCYFCELADLSAAWPELLAAADLLILNIARAPSIPLPEAEAGDLHEIVLARLAASGVKSAIIPSEKGLMLTLPSLSPERREYAKERHEIEWGGIKISVLHDALLPHYRNSVFPVSVQDERDSEAVLLGVGFGAALHRRIPSSGKQFEFTTLLAPLNSYRRLFACLDIWEQSAGRPFRIIAGKHMAEAIRCFSSLYCSTYRRPGVTIPSLWKSDENRSTEHLLYGDMEVLVIPYPAPSDACLVRLWDSRTKEYLLFAESLENLVFLEKNLPGLQTLAVSFDGVSEKVLSESFEMLRRLQKKHDVQRLILLSPDETRMVDLTI